MSQRMMVQAAVCHIEDALRSQGIKIHPDSACLELTDQKVRKSRRINAFDKLMGMSDVAIVDGLELAEFNNFAWEVRLEGENTNIRYMCW